MLNRLSLPGLTPQVGFTRLEALYYDADLGHARGPVQSILFARTRRWMRGSSPMGANLRRIVNLSVVIVRACGRSSNHGKSGVGTTVPQPAVRGLLDAPLEEGQVAA